MDFRSKAALIILALVIGLIVLAAVVSVAVWRDRDNPTITPPAAMTPTPQPR